MQISRNIVDGPKRNN